MGCNTSNGMFDEDLYGRCGDKRLPLTFAFKDSNGDILDISQYKFFIELKGTSNVLYQIGNGLSIVDNKLIWDFGNKLTLAPDTYTYGIKIVDNINQPTTIIQGNFYVSEEIVRVQ